MGRASIVGGVDESLKRVKSSTQGMLRKADSDIHGATPHIMPERSDLVLVGRFVPDDVIIMEGTPAGPYHIAVPDGMAGQLDVLQHTSRYALM